MLPQHMFLNWLEITNSKEKRQLDGKLKEVSRDLDFVNNLLEKRNIKKKQR